MAPNPRIGTKIRRAMERKRLNQSQLAELLGVSRSAVNAWINDRAWPQGSIGALEDVLGISLDTGEPQPLTEGEREEVMQEILRLAALLSEEGQDAAASAQGPEGDREGTMRNEGKTA